MVTRHDSQGMPSIHELEQDIRLEHLPPFDADDRALFVDRVLPVGLGFDAYARGEYQPVRSWARTAFAVDVHVSAEALELTCRAPELEKRLRFDHGGGLTVAYRWDPAAFPLEACFAPEISLAHPLELTCAPAADVWSFPIATVSKSERGLDETVQGHSFTPRFPAGVSEARIEVPPPSA